ncbi:MAG: hypothetical protein ACREUP_08510 [Burkholderiales bacterium]
MTKKHFIKQAEVYAAYRAYTDHEIGRVIQAVKGAGHGEPALPGDAAFFEQGD